MPETTDPTPDSLAVRLQLRALLATDAFRESERHRRLLEFLVESTLRGEADGLKEFVIAVEVWGRNVSFDPRIHSTVRVEVGRLRSRLSRYYAQTGANDPIQFRIPTGGYAVVFEPGPDSATVQAVAPSGAGEDRFEMLQLIGRGGMGEVWSARDRRLHRNVALKFISMDFARNRAARERFEREARAAAALNHPNICTIYDVGETGGQPFLAMELLEGETLEHRLAEQSVPVDSLVNWGIEIADALEAAHSHGIVHSDLKPGNLFLTTRGQTKILDFGLARLASERNDGAERVTSGTPGYMSPEQIKGEPLDSRSDLYSLGIVLYRAASGRFPERKPGPPSSYNRQVPPELDRIIAKALEPDRDVRYQHASEVRADLKRLKRDSSGSFASDPVLDVKSEPQPAARPLRLGWVISGLVALLLFVVAAIVWHFRELTAPAFREFSIVRASDSQNVQLTAISPDGKYLATVHKDAKGGQTLWVRHLASNSDRRLWEDPRYLYKRIVFSPDSSYIYFRAAALNNPVIPGANHDNIFRIPVIGGEPIDLIHGADSQISFYDSGQRLCFYRGDYEHHQFFFVGASAEGGDERVLAKVAGALPSVSECSPDGTKAVLTYLNDKMDILDFATGHIESLLKPGGVSGPIYGVNWTPGGKGMMVSSTRTSVGLAQLGYVAYPDGEFREITHNLNTYLHGVSFTADGRKMATTEGREETSFTLAPLADPSRAKDAPFTWANSFVWLGAGRLLAAGADSTLKLADLSAPEGSAVPVPAGYFFNDPEQCGANSIVASGGTVDGATRGIYRVGLDGSGFKQLTSGRGDIYPMCTPDGTWLLYVSSEDGLHHTLQRMPLAGGSPQAVGSTPGGTSIFSISPDGKLVAQVDYEGFTPVMKLTSTAAWQQIGRIPLQVASGRTIAFSADSKSVFFVSWQGGTGSIWIVPVDGSPVKQLLTTPGKTIRCIRPSPDGVQIGFIAYAQQADAVIIEDKRR